MLANNRLALCLATNVSLKLASKQLSPSLQAGWRFDSQKLTRVKIDSSLGVVDDKLDQWFLITHLSSLETPGVSQDQWRSWSTLLNSTLGVTSTLKSADRFDHIRMWWSILQLGNVLYRLSEVRTSSRWLSREFSYSPYSIHEYFILGNAFLVLPWIQIGLFSLINIVVYSDARKPNR